MTDYLTASRVHVPDGVSLEDAFERASHLAIGAHPDDLEIFAYHGIACCFEDADRWFGGVTVTDGAGCARGGPFASVSDRDMKEIRYREQISAADLGRYSFQCQFGYSSAEICDDLTYARLVSKLREIVDSCRPEVLYLHNPADKHPTHLRVLTACIDAVRAISPENRPGAVWGCEVWRDLDWLRDSDKVILPTDAYPDLARGLIEVFASQIAGGKGYVDAVLGRRRANATFFASHEVDGIRSCCYAMDLGPLFGDDPMSIEALLKGHSDHFASDLVGAIRGAAGRGMIP